MEFNKLGRKQIAVTTVGYLHNLLQYHHAFFVSPTLPFIWCALMLQKKYDEIPSIKIKNTYKLVCFRKSLISPLKMICSCAKELLTR